MAPDALRTAHAAAEAAGVVFAFEAGRLRVTVPETPPARAAAAVLRPHAAVLHALLRPRCSGCDGPLAWTPDWPRPSGEGRWLCLGHARLVSAALALFEGASIVAENVPAAWPPEGGWIPGPEEPTAPAPPADPHAALRTAVLARAEAAGWPPADIGGPWCRHLGGEPGWRPGWASRSPRTSLRPRPCSRPATTPCR